MEQYVIKGGNPLVGEVEIGGAKNAALAILSAAIMTDETILIENLPDVRDINVLLEAIAGIVSTRSIRASADSLTERAASRICVYFPPVAAFRMSEGLVVASVGLSCAMASMSPVSATTTVMDLSCSSSLACCIA